MEQLIKNNSDFLFIYEGINCNPNGDPDTENQPRLDSENSINLVTDVRIKRYIRDYLKAQDYPVFVDLEEGQHVAPKERLETFINQLNEEKIKNLYQTENMDAEPLLKVFHSLKKDESLSSKLLIKKSKEENSEEKTKPIKAKDKVIKEITNDLVYLMVKNNFSDIRLFGSAFAIDGVTRTFTGPIQLTWGYSLNKVKLIESTSLVTIMEDSSSTFGKDYRLYYSLLSFHGTINKHCAKYVGLKPEDIEIFRDAIWNSISALPTRSKLNQYPKLYLEIIYNENYGNGQFGDLRNYLKVSPKVGLTFDKVRKFVDLNIDFTKLIDLINSNCGEDKIIKDVIIRHTDDLNFNL